MTAELYTAEPYEAIPMSDSRCLLIAQNGVKRYVVTPSLKRVLDGCRHSRPLPGHVDQLVASLHLGEDQRPAVAKTLEDLVAQGLLVPTDGWLVAHNEPAERPPRITTLGFLTAERPAELRRAVSTYRAHLAAHDRQLTTVVMDDSRLGANREANRAILSQPGIEGETRYAGPAEKRAFLNCLAKRGIPPDVAAFGLMGDCIPGAVTMGANRNALLLDTVSEALLSADDDTVARLAYHPDHKPGITFMSHDNPRDMWFHETRDDVERACEWTDGDLIAEHERILGWRIGDLASSGRADVRFEKPCIHLIRGLQSDHGHVLASMSGIAGDCGAYCAQGVLMSERSRRWGLADSESIFRRALVSREVFWVAPEHTIGHGSPVQATALGLFNAAPLPPFCPVGRNEDGVFGALLGFAAPDGYVGHVPVAVFHAAPRGRTYPKFPEIRIADLIIALILQIPAWQGDVYGALRSVGRQLSELGRLPGPDFWAVAFSAAARGAAERCHLLELTMKALPRSPAYWQDYVEGFLRESAARLLRADFCVPAEFRESLPPDEARRKTQDAVRLFGDFLSAWPDIVAVARGLRKEGIRLSREVSGSPSVMQAAVVAGV